MGTRRLFHRMTNTAPRAANKIYRLRERVVSLGDSEVGAFLMTEANFCRSMERVPVLTQIRTMPTWQNNV